VLGEGLHWDERRNLLWFVDIHGPTVYWLDPDSGQTASRSMPEPVGWVLSASNSERVLVGLKSGVGLLNAFDEAEPFEWLDRRFPGDPGQRLNDAKADSLGRLWYGSLSVTDESQPVGRFARYEIGASAPVIVDSGYMVSNGPAFSEDCTLMLHSDSLRRVTYRYAVDVRSGAASERVLWKSFAEDDGYPDGMTFDAEDCVWIAHWGAAKLCRYDSEGNRLLTVEIPTSNVSNVCFGGKDMSRMFVTTASQGLSDAQRASQSAAGALLEVSGVDVRGGRSRQVKI
jgi:sugar lactone lactonase YvrE